MEELLHNPHVLALLSSAGAMTVVILIWSALVESDPLSSRLKNVSERRSELRAQERHKKMTRHSSISQNSVIKQIVEKLKLAQGKKLVDIRLKLARAGYRSRDTLFKYFFAKLIGMPAAAALCFFLLFVAHVGHMKPMVEVLILCTSALLGLFLPDIMIYNAAQKREIILRKALPDALDLLVICAEAGLSLDGALERVSREIGPSCAELAEEIGLTAVELSFYPERSKALQNLADRVPLQGVMSLTNTLIQTEKYGTPLAQALRVLSAEMRDERISAAEAKAAKLPATLTVPMILFIFPPLFVVLIGPAIIKVMNITSGH